MNVTLKNYLNETTIVRVDSVSDWKEAITTSAQPLLNNEVITQEYIEAIFRGHEKLGPYYVLGPGIAMPHARPEEGALGLGLSMLIIKEGVSFNSKHNDPVHLVVMLAATDAQSHLGLLQQLAELFSEDEDINKIIDASSLEQIINIIDKY